MGNLQEGGEADDTGESSTREGELVGSGGGNRGRLGDGGGASADGDGDNGNGAGLGGDSRGRDCGGAVAGLAVDDLGGVDGLGDGAARSAVGDGQSGGLEGVWLARCRVYMIVDQGSRDL